MNKTTIESLTTSGQILTEGFMPNLPMNVPGSETGKIFKVDVAFYQSDERTEKFTYWISGDEGEPHDHPWRNENGIAFVSTIEGEYTERRWTPQPDGSYVVSDHTYKTGDKNIMPFGVFHKVIDVKYGTRSHMICSPAIPGRGWGFLNPETFAYTPATRTLEYAEKMRHANPHMEALKATKPA